MTILIQVIILVCTGTRNVSALLRNIRDDSIESNAIESDAIVHLIALALELLVMQYNLKPSNCINN